MSASVAELVASGSRRLSDVTAAPRMEAEFFLCETLQQSHVWLIAHPEADVGHAPQAAFERACARRAAGEPFQYIVGSSGFYGRTFAVNAAVLVPRPETEHLIDAALEYCGADRRRPLRICDVGTGCGAIAITLACELPNASVVAIDVSADALSVARTNAARHGVAQRLTLGAADLLLTAIAHGPFDLIAANLPYVSTSHIPPYPATLAYEPRVALDGGADGLDVYRRFLPLAKARLARLGCLIMEAGADSAEALGVSAGRIFSGADVSVLNDYAQQPRLVIVRQGPP